MGSSAATDLSTVLVAPPSSAPVSPSVAPDVRRSVPADTCAPPETLTLISPPESSVSSESSSSESADLASNSAGESPVLGGLGGLIWGFVRGGLRRGGTRRTCCRVVRPTPPPAYSPPPPQSPERPPTHQSARYSRRVPHGNAFRRPGERYSVMRPTANDPPLYPRFPFSGRPTQESPTEPSPARRRCIRTFSVFSRKPRKAMRWNRSINRSLFLRPGPQCSRAVASSWRERISSLL